MAKIILKNVRINFPRLVVAQENRYSQDGRKFYSAQIVIAEDDKENLQKVAAGMKEAFVAKFGDKAERVLLPLRRTRTHVACSTIPTANAGTSMQSAGRRTVPRLCTRLT